MYRNGSVLHIFTALRMSYSKGFCDRSMLYNLILAVYMQIWFVPFQCNPRIYLKHTPNFIMFLKNGSSFKNSRAYAFYSVCGLSEYTIFVGFEVFTGVVLKSIISQKMILFYTNFI
jgi:hypothetical protein